MIVPRSSQPVSIPGSNVKMAFDPGNLNHLGRIARGCGAQRALLVSDPGIVAAGHVDRALQSLRDAGIHVEIFTDVAENPTVEHVAAGAEFAAPKAIDFIIGLGGGSAMDCAKGINFILTNGGRMQDYWGVNLAKRPLLPMIAVPTTAGTGSEAQSFALITDPQTHQKMACGASSALPKVAILDPDLTATQPPPVAAATGIDAITHAVETSATTRRNAVSRKFSRMAWDLLESSYANTMRNPGDANARERMLVGAHLAGAAIENSMLGAAHALANALTAVSGVVHGIAVGMMLPHVIRFNAAGGDNPYTDLDPDAENLAQRIERFLTAGNLPRRMSDCGISADVIPELSTIAAKQWTATFNPRPVGQTELRQIFMSAF